MMESVLSDESMEKIAIEIIQRVANFFEPSKLGDSVLLEVLRIISSDFVISSALGIELSESIRNPNVGVREFSSRCPEDKRKEVMSSIEKIALTGVSDSIYEMPKLSPYEHTKVLEFIHALTVYNSMDFTSGELKINGSNGQRKRQGAFYTPSDVSRFICEGTIGEELDAAIDSALKNGTYLDLICLLDADIVDPACGPGTFLIESLMVYKRRYATICSTLNNLDSGYSIDSDLAELMKIINNERKFLTHIAQRLYGVDIDLAAIEIASISIGILLEVSIPNIKWSFMLNLKSGNSLVSEFPFGILNLDDEMIRKLLGLRDDFSNNSDFDVRKRKYKEFREEVTRIEKTMFLSFGGKRASEILHSDDIKSAFNWELEFPEIFIKSEKGTRGFRYVVMNPPYDILKLNRSEYINGCQSKEEHGLALDLFETHKALEKSRASFFRNSGHYMLSANNVINLYRLMVERALQISSTDARLGFIVPSTIICDSSTALLRREILENYLILGIDDFSEKARVFAGVTQAVSIMRIDKKYRSSTIPLALYSSRIVEFGYVDYCNVPLALIQSVSGDSMRIPRASTNVWSLLEQIHIWPKAVEQNWIVNRRGELDLTLYKEYITAKPTKTRLVRGNHISRYELKWQPKTKESYVVIEGFLTALKGSSKKQDIQRTRIAGQQVSNMAQKRRLKCTLTKPGDVLGNSCNYLYVRNTNNDSENLMYLLGLMNSHLLNWRFRLTSTNNHVNNRDLDELPIVPPDVDDKQLSQLIRKIGENATKLSTQFDVSLDNETESLVFRLYSVSTDDALMVLLDQGVDEDQITEIVRLMN